MSVAEMFEKLQSNPPGESAERARMASRAKQDPSGAEALAVYLRTKSKKWKEGGGAVYRHTFVLLDRGVEVRYWRPKHPPSAKSKHVPIVPENEDFVDKLPAMYTFTIKELSFTRNYVRGAVYRVMGLKWELGQWKADDGTTVADVSYVCAQIVPQSKNLGAHLAQLPYADRRIAGNEEEVLEAREEARKMQLGSKMYAGPSEYHPQRGVFFTFDQAVDVKASTDTSKPHVAVALMQNTKYAFTTKNKDLATIKCIRALSDDGIAYDFSVAVLQGDGSGPSEIGTGMLSVWSEHLKWTGIGSDSAWEKVGRAIVHGAAGSFFGYVGAKTDQMAAVETMGKFVTVFSGSTVFDVRRTVSNVGLRVSRDRAFGIMEGRGLYNAGLERMNTNKWDAFCGKNENGQVEPGAEFGLQPNMECVPLGVTHGLMHRLRDCAAAEYYVVSPHAHKFKLADLASGSVSEAAYLADVANEDDLLVFVATPPGQPFESFLTNETRAAYEARTKAAAPAPVPVPVPVLVQEEKRARVEEEVGSGDEEEEE